MNPLNSPPDPDPAIGTTRTVRAHSLEGRLIRVAYGDASLLDRGIVAWHQLFRNKRVRERIQRHRELAGRLRRGRFSERPLPCPPSLSEQILDDTIRSSPPVRNPLPFSLGTLAGTGAALALLALAASFLVWHQQGPEPAVTAVDLGDYTLAELEQAEAEARHSLALVSAIMRDTGLAVKSEVFHDGVNQPIQSGMEQLRGILTNNKHEPNPS